MLVEHVFSDRPGTDRANQNPRPLQIVARHTEFYDLAHRGIAQQVIGNLDGDFHRDLGGAFIAFGFGFFLVVGAVGSAGYLGGAVGGGPADFTYPVRRLDIAHRPSDFLVPDLLSHAPTKPPHRPCPEYNLAAPAAAHMSPPPTLDRRPYLSTIA